MPEADLMKIQRLLMPRLSERIPAKTRLELLPKQIVFLALTDTLEVLYGGAAGGGKSEALLVDASRDVDTEPTKALLIRRTFKDLAQPGGLMARSHEWWRNTDAAWDSKNYTWNFPSGASVSFGYMEHDGDELRYQGGEYHIIGFDELTQLREYQYHYLFSRIRRLKGSKIKPRVRSATNPGGPGHEWVRKRFNLPHGPTFPANRSRKFIFANLDDNFHLDQENYLESLMRLKETGSDVTYRQLREGDWTAMGSGGFFHPDKFLIIPWGDVPPSSQFRNIVRYWDFGATEVSDMNPDPDYTVGLKIGITHRGHGPMGLPDWYVFDVVRTRQSPGGIESLVRDTARKDGLGVAQWLEQERGSAGKHFVHSYRTNHLAGYDVRGMYVTGDKETRAKGAAARVEEGRVFLVEGPWNEDFMAEAGAFPNSNHDDQVDGFSYGMMALEREQTMAGGGTARRVGYEMPQVARMSEATRGRHVGW